jgi:hypothetical protein
MPIAYGSLCHLGDQRLRVSQQQLTERAIAIKLIFEPLPRQAICAARTLHDRTIGGRLSTHEKRNADQPVVAHDGNLRGGPVRKHIQKRDDAINWKINIAQ